MKSQILFFGTIFLLLTTLASAQNWGADGARWWYDYNNFGYIGYREIFVVGDTVVGDKAVKVFHRKAGNYWQVMGTYRESEGFFNYMYEKEGIVYLWQSNEFDTLYNFNASVGDTWSITGTFDLPILAKVLEKGNRIINGQTLKWSKVEYRVKARPAYDRFVLTDTIVETIGNLHSYMMPWDYFAGQSDANDGGFLRCYWNEKMGFYHSPFYKFSCDAVVSHRSWGADVARWRYSYNNFGYTGFSEIVLEKDTLIRNQIARKYNRSIQFRNLRAGYNGESRLSPIIISERQDIIYLLTENGFDTLYNFSAKVGDKWGIQRYATRDALITEVLNTGFRTVNSRNLRWQLVKHYYQEYPQYGYQDTLIERMGSINHYMLPWDYFAAGVDAHQGGDFRCYEDLNFGKYQNPAYEKPCDFVTATNEIELSNTIQISPNPFTEFVKISFAKPIPTDIEIIIHSVEGRAIKRMLLPANAEQFEIPLTTLHQGYYLLTLMEQGRIVYATKVVKL